MNEILLHGITVDELVERVAKRTVELLSVTQEEKIEDDLITPKEACKLLQCTTVTLWRWEKKGRITPYGIGGKKFFKRSELLNSIIKK